MTNAIVLQPGEGRKYWLVGDHITMKVAAPQTGGAYSAALTWVGPGMGPPPHVHHREDELFYVVEGELTFIYDRQTFVGEAGTAVYLKKDIPHAFANKTDKPARFLLIAVPSGFENFVAECGTEIDRIPSDLQVTPAAIEKLLKTVSKYGIEVLMDHRPGGQTVPPRDRLFDVLGQTVKLKLDSVQTNGHFCVCEIGTPPGSILPLHRHLAMDEMFYVVEGDYLFTIDGSEYPAPPGTFIHIPRGTPHRLQNIGKTPGRLANFHTPGGFEKFFEECGGPINRARLPQMLAAHGMELISID
jgi:quercetin dioxygenase-like cupin family protein